VNASFLALNRNERSLAVDLKSPEGRQIVLDRVNELFARPKQNISPAPGGAYTRD
jgi:CoA-transferase family III